MTWISCIRERGDLASFRQDFFDQLYPSAEEVGGHSRDAGDVAARIHKTVDKSGLNEISSASDNDRNRVGGFLSGNGDARAADDDQVGLSLDQLARELSQAIHFSVSIAPFDNDVFAFFIAKRA